MKYAPPLGSTDPNAPYVDGNPAAGIQGSAVPAAALEPTMREIVNAITAAGLEPDGDNLMQLAEVLQSLANKDLDNLSQTGIDYIKQFVSVPVGSMIMWPGATIPPGWLRCTGSNISRITYSELFEALGITWGEGDGSTTFKLPSTNDRVPIGSTDLVPLGTLGGQTLPNITGNITSLWAYSSGSPANGAFSATQGDSNRGVPSPNPAQYDFNFNASRSSSIYGASQNGVSGRVLPYTFGVYFIIKYQ